MSEIEQISEAQLAKIQKYADKWKKMFLSIAPTDERKAVAAINALYENAGLEKPGHVFFLESPMGCYLAKAAIETLISNQQSGESQSLWDKVKRNYLKKQIVEPGEIDLEKVFTEVARSIEESMDGKAWPLHIGREVGENVCSSVLRESAEKFSERFGQDAWYEVDGRFSQQVGHWYNWASIFLEDILDEALVKDRGSRPNPELDQCHRNYGTDIYAHMFGMEEFMAKELGIPSVEKISPLIDVSEECGWVLPHANACFVSRKPIAVHFDDDKRHFHKFGGKALEYADSWGIWAINGIQMPGKYARELPENWKSEWLLETSNAKQRSVIIGAIGYSKIMRELGATQIHADGDMSLHKIDRDFDVEPVYLLMVRCPSTEASYALRVPPHVKTCEEARMALMRNSKGNYTFVRET